MNCDPIATQEIEGALTLIAILVAMVIGLSYGYWRRGSHIKALNGQQDQAEAKVNELNEHLAGWDKALRSEVALREQFKDKIVELQAKLDRTYVGQRRVRGKFVKSNG